MDQLYHQYEKKWVVDIAKSGGVGYKIIDLQNRYENENKNGIIGGGSKLSSNTKQKQKKHYNHLVKLVLLLVHLAFVMEVVGVVEDFHLAHKRDAINREILVENMFKFK